MNSFNLLLPFSDRTCITLRVEAAFWISQVAQLNTLLKIFWFCFEKPRLWKAMAGASGFIKDFDSLFPLGKNVVFPPDESVTSG